MIYLFHRFDSWPDFEEKYSSQAKTGVMKFVSDLQQVGGFIPGTPVSSTNKTDRYDIALNTLTLTLSPKPPWT
jgi:hypothetical protein